MYQKGDRVFIPEFGSNGTVIDVGEFGPDTITVTLDKPAYGTMWTVGFFASDLVPEKIECLNA